MKTYIYKAILILFCVNLLSCATIFKTKMNYQEQHIQLDLSGSDSRNMAYNTYVQLSFSTKDVLNCLEKAEISELVNEIKPAGQYSLNWDASNYATGIYFIKMQAGEYLKITKGILMK